MKRTSRQELQIAIDALKKHGTLRRAAEALGIPYTTFADRVSKARRAALEGAQPGAGRTDIGYTRADFRERYDKSFIVPRRIREALKKLGQSRYLPEAEFSRLAGVSLPDLGRFRAEFDEDHVVVVERSKRLWCGSKALAEELRGLA